MPGPRSNLPAVASRPTVVAIVFREEPGTAIAASVGEHAGSAGIPVRVEVLDWVDDPKVRRAKVRARVPNRWIRAHEPPLREDQRASLAGSDVLVAAELPVDIADMAPGVRFVQSIGAGVDPLACVLRGSGWPLCSAAGLSGDKVAEFVMARLLGVWLRLRQMEELQRARRWAPDDADAEEIGGRTLLVVGTGGIGRAVARRAAAFDLRCVGVRRRPELGVPDGFDRVVGPEELTSELPTADAVVLAAPATARTARIIGPAQLEAMKPGAVLCNVARGSLVDETAVVSALESGSLGAAILDVTDVEPLSRRSPLWRNPGAYLSPHAANNWLRTPYLARVGALTVENIVRDRRREPLRNRVDLEEGY